MSWAYLLIAAFALGIVGVPVWFVVKCAGLLISPEKRENFRSGWPLYLILGLATFVILYFVLGAHGPRHPYYPNALDSIVNVPITHDEIQKADAIVEGSFDPAHLISSAREEMPSSFGPKIEVESYWLPFAVDRSAKGHLPPRIRVKIFFPADGAGFSQWGFPLKEKLLLILKREPGDDAYSLLHQQTSWLVLPSFVSHAPPASGAAIDADAFVLDDAKAFLRASLANPGAAGNIAYVTSVGAFLPTEIRFPDNDPARAHALEIGRNLANDDPDFLSLAEEYEGQSNDLGRQAREIRADRGDYTVLAARLDAFNAGRLPAINGQFNFPWEMETAVGDSRHLDKMMPLITQALASPDARMRQFVLQGLRTRQEKGNGEYGRGNQLGNEFYPIFVKLLDDPDWQVQYQAMACIFLMSGEMRKPVHERELNLWAIDIYRQNPDRYLTQYRAWWQRHQDELK